MQRRLARRPLCTRPGGSPRSQRIARNRSHVRKREEENRGQILSDACRARAATGVAAAPARADRRGRGVHAVYVDGKRRSGCPSVCASGPWQACGSAIPALGASDRVAEVRWPHPRERDRRQHGKFSCSADDRFAWLAAKLERQRNWPSHLPVPALGPRSSTKVQLTTRLVGALRVRSGTYQTLICTDIYSQIRRFTLHANCSPGPKLTIATSKPTTARAGAKHNRPNAGSQPR